MIDLKATAMAGLAAITAIIVGFIVEIANGHNGSPYVVLGAIAGFAYIVAFLVERRRS
jgi:presenilin-like A22 family membrane protease